MPSSSHIVINVNIPYSPDIPVSSSYGTNHHIIGINNRRVPTPSYADTYLNLINAHVDVAPNFNSLSAEGVYSANSLYIGEEDGGTTEIHGGSRVAVFIGGGATELYPVDIRITGGKFYNSQTAGEVVGTGITPVSAMYIAGSVPEVYISGVTALGGSNGIYAQMNAASVVHLSDLYVEGTGYAITAYFSTIHVHPNVVTQYGNSELMTRNGGTIIDDR